MKFLRLETLASVSIAVLLVVAFVMPGGGGQIDDVRDAARTLVPLAPDDASVPR